MILRLDLHRADTMWLIEKLSLFNKTMEQGLTDSRQTDRIVIDNYPIESHDDFDTYNERLHEHRLLFEQDFPSQVRYSFVILAYTIFEDRAKALCGELNMRKIIVGKVLSDKPGFVKNLKRFFTSVWVKEQMWKEVSDFSTIRNCLIHADGRPSRVNREGTRKNTFSVVKKTTACPLMERGEFRSKVSIVLMWFHS